MGRKADIIQAIRSSGFIIAQEREIKLTKEQAQEFYKEHKGKPFYDDLTQWMSRWLYSGAWPRIICPVLT